MIKPLPVIVLTLFLQILAVSVGYTQESEPPQKVSTSVGIYDVQSPDDIHKFSANEVRQLVHLENARPQGPGILPHPVLVYCFEEKTFRYTGGKYQDAEIKYRLHSPKTIRYGRKYPLVIHLHGSGESGSDNTFSLIYLHAILPLLIGQEQQDFFLLVAQCPQETPHWSFNSSKDGTLDIVMALREHLVTDNPIDKKRITVTGISSGGYGTWELIQRYPDMFAGAVPVNCNAPHQFRPRATLKHTPVWTYVYSGDLDGKVNLETIQTAMHAINDSGGSMAYTVPGSTGRIAWGHPMEDYFRWMLAQKKGSWFSTPPGVWVNNKPYPSYLVFLMFVLPLALIVFLAWGTICEQVSAAYQSMCKWFSHD
jgi:predicted esterase